MGDAGRLPVDTRVRAENVVDELALLRGVGIIASLPGYTVEQRFDLALLHVTYLPLKASRPTGADISDVFSQGLDTHRLSRLNYLTTVCFTNMAGGGRSVWSSFAAESIGVLDSRRLFSDPDYRRRITGDYALMLRSGFLDGPTP